MAALRDTPLPSDGTNWSAWGSAVDKAARGANPGIVQIDDPDFGATDAAKMQGFLTYAAAQTRAPWGQLPARVFDTGATTYQMFTGMKILGAGYSFGPQNEEISAGKGVTGKWKTTCGNLASSLLQSTATMYDIKLSGVVFHGGSTSQILRSTVNTYACGFDNLTFYGCKHAVGAPTEKFLMTQHVWGGHWTVLSYTDTQFTIGGGDSSLFKGGYINSNSPPATAGAGKPIMDLQGMGKTNIGFLYLTAENDWVGLRVNGGGLDKAVYIDGGVFEGRSPTNVATRPLIDLVSGLLVVNDMFCGQVTSGSATVNGVINQSGGRLVLNDTLYNRGTSTAATFPLLYQTGGTAQVNRPVSSFGEQIRLRWSTGVTDTVPLPANGYTA